MAETPLSSKMSEQQTDPSEATEPTVDDRQEDLETKQHVRERPVREQLKNTSITPSDGLTPAVEDPTTAAAAEDGSSESGSAITDPEQTQKETDPNAPSLRGRRKRSFDEINPENADDSPTVANSKHFRKRSRDNRNITSREDDDEDDDDDEEDEDDNEDSDEDTVPPATTDTVVPQPTSTAADGNGPERATTPPTNSINSASSKTEDATSPQNKRNRDQFMIDHDLNSIAKANGEATSGSSKYTISNAPISTEAISTNAVAKTVVDEPETKRPRDESLPSTRDGESSTSPKLSIFGAGFANTSADSPFGALADSKSPQISALPQTSSSAFASSGFASFADSTQSPFGAVAPATKSENKDAKDKDSLQEPKKDDAPPSGFAALSNSQSPFATAGSSTFGSQSAFGKMSNGFGSFGGGDSKLGAPLSSFATPGVTGITGLSSKPSKPFGSPDPEEEEDGERKEEDGEGFGAVISPKEHSPVDPRFYEQEVETGEEDEQTLFSSRAKLYVSQDKQWKERGVGTLKVNASSSKDTEKTAEAAAKRTARFIMRADGSHRVVLNSPIKKEISLDDPAGGPPKGKSAVFLGFIDEKPLMMLLKMRSNVQTEELHNVIASLQKEL